MKVAVIGAGPAGSAAAVVLARAGARVTVYEKAGWPRPKTCGDGVSPDSIAALASLGVAIPADAPRCDRATVRSPHGHVAAGRWNGTVVVRRDLDAAIVEAACAAGAELRARTAVRALDGDSVVSDSGTGAVRERYDAVVLAEGATGALARTLGWADFRERQVAIRGYADARADLLPTFHVVYDRALTPGYGWIFPTGKRRANVGVCVPEAKGRAAGGLRALLAQWLASDATVRNLFGPSPDLDDVRGGVIPSCRPARFTSYVMAVGDAAGVADPLSAEGVSQALSTGMEAARALVDSDGDVVRASGAYARALRDFDRNASEARRLRALFRWTLDPMIRLAAGRPPLADHLVSVGFTLKTDGHWFWGVPGALLRSTTSR